VWANATFNETTEFEIHRQVEMIKDIILNEDIKEQTI